jgi:hypothetical protein
MKFPLLLASALTALIPVLAPAPGTPGTTDITGLYECEGTTANGAPYHGTVEIVRNNSTYEVLWTLGPREQYLGFGVVNENVLAVSVLAGMPGVVAYKIERSDKGARLVGQWTVPNAEGRVFSETLTRVANGSAPQAKPKPRAVEPPEPRGKVLPMHAVRSA